MVGQRDPYVRDDDYLEYVSRLSCLACLQTGYKTHDRCDPAHVKSRGAGGHDRGNVVPLCRIHHTEQGWGIKSFQSKYAIDLKAEAKRIEEAYTPPQEAF